MSVMVVTSQNVLYKVFSVVLQSRAFYGLNVDNKFNSWHLHCVQWLQKLKPIDVAFHNTGMG